MTQQSDGIADELRQVTRDFLGKTSPEAKVRELMETDGGIDREAWNQAAALGIPTAARAVGAANGANPVCIVLPCHRVIGANGSLTGFGGGLPVKQWLLDHEAQVARTIFDEPLWPARQPVQTRLSMPVA